ncbi:XrtA system polysaccharide deacetylase [Aestuariirhabdus litorea]|uniref:XrtA system polysaccharide deacetylase n=1 Tax=Aestuariirhabdus litorea TaxID=2528527 RepID=UPI001A9FA424|nr:XrtA system polysaccharide deacetylase [Aestuariirhabdus litorea]
MLNAMTVDVEEYFQVSAFANVVSRADWSCYESRVQASMERILALFDRHGIKATFFVLGWIAREHPTLVQRLISEGHEVGSHGMYHDRVTDLSPDELASDLADSRKLLEDICGCEVKGYRAPSFSLPLNPLSYEVLAQAGYRYSSSIYPIKHDHYGAPESERFSFEGGSGVLEIPISTLRFFGKNLPVGGGGFFRLLPYPYHRYGFSRLNNLEGRPGVFYMHPWEIDPYQPRPSGLSLKSRFRHYLNLHKTYTRLGRLLGDHQWSSIERIYEL